MKMMMMMMKENDDAGMRMRLSSFAIHLQILKHVSHFLPHVLRLLWCVLGNEATHFHQVYHSSQQTWRIIGGLNITFPL